MYICTYIYVCLYREDRERERERERDRERKTQRERERERLKEINDAHAHRKHKQETTAVACMEFCFELQDGGRYYSPFLGGKVRWRRHPYSLFRGG